MSASLEEKRIRQHPACRRPSARRNGPLHVSIGPFASIITLLIISFGCTQPTQRTTTTQGNSARPNFIIILADDLGYGDISPYDGWIETPHLDAMASEGMLFADFHSNGTVCSPTRAALMTGRYQQRAGIDGVVYADPARPQHRHGLQHREHTLAEALSARGYATALFGKWHLGYEPQYNPTNHGFDTFRGFVSGNVDYFSHVDQAGAFDWWIDQEQQQEDGYTTRLITRHAESFIESHGNDPFLLVLNHAAPHYPYQAPDGSPSRSVGEPTNQPLTVQERRETYRRMVQDLDAGVGAVLNAVKKAGIDDRTLIVFCSDNGANANGSNAPLRGRKGQLWEGGHRVPAIARWPGRIKPGSSCDQPAMTMDLMPTILAIAEPANQPTSPPQYTTANFDGINLSPALFRHEPLTPRTLFWLHGQRIAVRDGNWKLIWNTSQNTAVSLHNLASDPAEKHDVRDANPQVTQSLSKLADSWLADVRHNASPQP